MSVFPAPVSMPPMSALVAFRKISPSVSWTTFTNGPPSSVTVSMRPRNFSQTTVSGRPEPKVLVLSTPRMH